MMPARRRCATRAARAPGWRCRSGARRCRSARAGWCARPRGAQVAILSLGPRLADALVAADELAARGLPATVADARFAKPLDTALIERLAREHAVLVTIEDGSVGGFGSPGDAASGLGGLLDGGLKIRPMVLPDRFIDHNTPAAQLAEAGLTAKDIVRTVVDVGQTTVKASVRPVIQTHSCSRFARPRSAVCRGSGPADSPPLHSRSPRWTRVAEHHACRQGHAVRRSATPRWRPIVQQAFDLDTILETSVGPRWQQLFTSRAAGFAGGVPPLHRGELCQQLSPPSTARNSRSTLRHAASAPSRSSKRTSSPRMGDPARLDYVMRQGDAGAGARWMCCWTGRSAGSPCSVRISAACSPAARLRWSPACTRKFWTSRAAPASRDPVRRYQRSWPGSPHLSPWRSVAGRDRLVGRPRYSRRGEPGWRHAAADHDPEAAAWGRAAAEEALASFCAQDYPQFPDRVRPCRTRRTRRLHVIRRLRARFPHCRHRCRHRPGPTRRQSQDQQSDQHVSARVKHDVLVMADSDIHAPADYLTKLAAELDPPGVGWSPRCMPASAHPERLPARLGCRADQPQLPARRIAGPLARPRGLPWAPPWRCAARRWRVSAACTRWSTTWLTTRVGSVWWRPVARPWRWRQPCPRRPCRRCGSHLFAHELRWGRTIQSLAPIGFRLSSLQYPLFWAGWPSVLSGFETLGAPAVRATWLTRAAVMLGIDAALGLSTGVPVWLLPFRDLLSVAVILASYGGHRVAWRGTFCSISPPRLAAGKG